MRKNIAVVLAAAFIAASMLLGGCTAQDNSSYSESNASVSFDTASGSPSGNTTGTQSQSTSGTMSGTTSDTTSMTTSMTTSSTTSATTSNTTSMTTSNTTSTSAQTAPPKTDPPKTAPPATDPPKTAPPATDPPKTDPPATEKQPSGISKPYVPTLTASGKTVYKGSYSLIDASDTSKGYIMVKLTSAKSGEYKAVVMSPNGTYTYNLDASGGEYTIVPLTAGNGTYTVYVGSVVPGGGSIAPDLAQDISVSIASDFDPWLSPNAYCMYSASSNCVIKASQLCGGFTELEKVEAIYKFVMKNTDYVPTAASSADGYVPYPDRTYASGQGICFDYASLMAAMLRSQQIPTKIVVGYAGSTYHAWLSVYITGQGWVDGIIRFDGNKWTRMDPTFADGAYGTSSYQQWIDYIADDNNYIDYLYY